MSKSSAQEKRRQESNARNRRLAAKYQSQASQLQTTFNSNQEELDRLKTAQKSLKKNIKSYNETKTAAQKSLIDNIEDASFKGTIRTKYDTNATTLLSDMKTDIQTHSDNLATLGQEITNRQMSLDLLGSQISSLNKSASDCLAAIY